MHYKYQVCITLLFLQLTSHTAGERCSLWGLANEIGNGWDAIDMKEMKPIFNTRPGNCQKTRDKKFVIGDKIEDYNEATTELYADLPFRGGYEPLKSKGMKPPKLEDRDVRLQIEGTFSDDYKEIKKRELIENRFTIRIVAKKIRYKVGLTSKNEDKDMLDKKFREQLDKLVNEKRDDNNEGLIFLGDDTVRQYGTHVITSVAIGAMFIREDYFEPDFVSKYADEDLIANAMASFIKEFKFDKSIFTPSYKEPDTVIKAYDEKRKGTKTYTVGGPKNGEKMKGKDWLKGIGPDNFVVIDRFGSRFDGLLELIKPFYNTPDNVLEQAFLFVPNAVSKYYGLNTHKGCSRLDANTFDSTVNLIDPDPSKCNYDQRYFGGLYQICKPRAKYEEDYCKNYNSINDFTVKQSCPNSYSDKIFVDMDLIKWCPAIPKNRGLGLKECSVNVKTHLCITSAEPADKKMTYSFGGVFSKMVDNFLTGRKTCPSNFVAKNVIADGLLKICLSEEKVEHAEGTDLSFGGLCQIDDQCPDGPCPSGYSQHIGVLHEGREIYYCGRYGSEDKIFDINLMRPHYGEISMREGYGDNETITEGVGKISACFLLYPLVTLVLWLVV